MSGRLRRSAVIGLCVFLTGSPLSPILRAADAAVPSSAAVPATTSGPATAPPPAPPLSAPPLSAAREATAAPGQPSGTSPGAPAGATYHQLPTDFGLEVSPTRLAVTAADAVKGQQVQVINRGRAAAVVHVQKSAFVGATDGTMKYDAQAPNSAAGWVVASPDVFTLPPGGSRAVDLRITIPPGADPGDHQVAIVFLVPATKGSGNIRVNRGIGVPLYITVPGAVVTATDLQSLQIKGFSLGGAMTVTATLRNSGTVHRDFRGSSALTVSAAGRTASFPDFTMVRGSSRTISTTWDPPLMCICYPTVSLAQPDGSTVIASVRVIVFPLQWLGIIVIALLVAVLAIRWSRRRFNSRVLRAALAMNRAVSSGDA